LIEPEVERKVEIGVKESNEVQQLMEFYEEELNNSVREEGREAVNPLRLNKAIKNQGDSESDSEYDQEDIAPISPINLMSKGDDVKRS